MGHYFCCINSHQPCRYGVIYLISAAIAVSADNLERQRFKVNFMRAVFRAGYLLYLVLLRVETLSLRKPSQACRS